MKSSCAAYTLLALVLSSCAPTRHTVEPYRSDTQRAAQLERRAERVCQQSVTIGPPAKPFVTDGCTLWPDGRWVECCVTHDIPYWCGGSAQQRRDADRLFRTCVSDHSSAWMGALMFLGTRIGDDLNPHIALPNPRDQGPEPWITI